MEHYPIGKTIKQNSFVKDLKITELYYDGDYCVRQIQHGKHKPYFAVIKGDKLLSYGTDNTDTKRHILIPDSDGCIRDKKIYF